MKRDAGGKKAADGLELDKINLSDFAQGNALRPMPDADESPQQPPDNASKRYKKFRMALFAILGILVLLMALIALVKQQDLSFGLFTGKSDGSLKGHLKVGPISATLSNDDIIRFTVDIDCGNEKLKDVLSKRDSQIRDKIVSIITTPEAEQLLEKRQYDALKSKIRKGLDDITTEPIGDVYFSDLITY